MSINSVIPLTHQNQEISVTASKNLELRKKKMSSKSRSIMGFQNSVRKFPDCSEGNQKIIEKKSPNVVRFLEDYMSSVHTIHKNQDDYEVLKCSHVKNATSRQKWKFEIGSLPISLKSL